ncbi:hypothetical protein HS088_TW22G01483 [Tripterygium wilfordii]|uniref:BZIP domain-containing protein n=1 Tax=Tripterygium wilfordii TaxID=458696 RepID=A0A7J7C1Y4_TRIWF|nr:basic leucine zipper 43-like [Tripterygium wilfordii]KAF5727786.1 hypothetical protein HS088_TW22G01483 [Tripterygium wilfordii]
MLPGDISGVHFLLQQENHIPQSFNFNYPNPLLSVHEFTQQSSGTVSNNSTSDEADDLQQSVVDERKRRRMISNRESARRSRMRKQKHLDELWSQVLKLRTDNHNLIEKLNHVSECFDKVVQENKELKEEASDIREMLAELQIGSPSNYTAALRVLEEVPCNTAHVRAESSSSIQSNITSSINLRH